MSYGIDNILQCEGSRSHKEHIEKEEYTNNRCNITDYLHTLFCSQICGKGIYDRNKYDNSNLNNRSCLPSKQNLQSSRRQRNCKAKRGAECSENTKHYEEINNFTKSGFGFGFYLLSHHGTANCTCLERREFSHIYTVGNCHSHDCVHGLIDNAPVEELVTKRGFHCLKALRHNADTRRLEIICPLRKGPIQRCTCQGCQQHHCKIAEIGILRFTVAQPHIAIFSKAKHQCAYKYHD